MAEQIKKDRIGVLASTIIKELASSRLEAIRREDVETVLPPIVMTASLKRELLNYTSAKKMAKRAEKEIEKAGYRVSLGNGGEFNYEIARPYVRHDERKAEKIRLKNVRANTVRQLRTDALIDLVTLDPSKAKAAVQAFRKAIEAI